MKTKATKSPKACSKATRRSAATPAGRIGVASKPWGEYMHGVLQDDTEAAAYLEAPIDEGDSSGLMVALRRLAQVRVDVASIAERPGLSH